MDVPAFTSNEIIAIKDIKIIQEKLWTIKEIKYEASVLNRPSLI
jgi:hypothetical protein